MTQVSSRADGRTRTDGGDGAIVCDIRVSVGARACVDSIQFFRCYFAPPPPPTATVCGGQTSIQSDREVLRGRAFLSQGQKWRSITVEIVKMVIAEKKWRGLIAVEAAEHHVDRDAN